MKGCFYWGNGRVNDFTLHLHALQNSLLFGFKVVKFGGVDYFFFVGAVFFGAFFFGSGFLASSFLAAGFGC